MSGVLDDAGQGSPLAMSTDLVTMTDEDEEGAVGSEASPIEEKDEQEGDFTFSSPQYEDIATDDVPPSLDPLAFTGVDQVESEGSPVPEIRVDMLEIFGKPTRKPSRKRHSFSNRSNGNEESDAANKLSPKSGMVNRTETRDVSPRSRKRKKSPYDGIDYDVTESLENLRTKQRQHENLTKVWCAPNTASERQTLLRWLLSAATALLVACTSYGMTMGVKYIHEAKFDAVQNHIDNDGLFIGYLVSLSIWTGLTMVATSLTYWAPRSAGSGIPQVKGFLNGVYMPGVFTMKTFVAKVIGITACLGIGFPAGRAGPMVQVGAVIGAGLSRGYSKLLCGVDKGEKIRLYASLDTPEQRRDFISLGSACGVAAAFGAPIGGILFTLEEVSSYWSPSLTFQAFAAACLSGYVVSALLSAAEIDDEGWVLFGTKTNRHTYKTWEVLPFIIVSIGGGFIAVIYNFINKLTLKLRNKYVKGHEKRRIAEAFVIILSIQTIFYWAPALYRCQAQNMQYKKQGIEYVNYTCTDGEFSPMATLAWNPQERLLSQLYSRETPGYFDPEILFVFLVLYLLLASITFGIVVPSGLFVPSMIIGSVWGRFCGEVLVKEFPETDPGVYALVGAASTLGGITRMTISLAAILVETTNDINTMLPIMLALVISKTIGDFFSASIYEMVLRSMGVILIPSELPAHIELQTVHDIMTQYPEVLPKITKVGAINYALKLPYNAFPVVAGEGSIPMLFCGLVTRRQLEFAMKSVFTGFGDVSLDARIPLDLRNYMTISPLIILETSPLRHAYVLFRSLGLRHLVVINSRHEVVGIVTRTDLSIHEVPQTTTLTAQHHDYPVVYSETEEALRHRQNSTFSLLNRSSSIALPSGTTLNDLRNGSVS